MRADMNHHVRGVVAALAIASAALVGCGEDDRLPIGRCLDVPPGLATSLRSSASPPVSEIKARNVTLDNIDIPDELDGLESDDAYLVVARLENGRFLRFLASGSVVRDGVGPVVPADASTAAVSSLGRELGTSDAVAPVVERVRESPIYRDHQACPGPA